MAFDELRPRQTPADRSRLDIVGGQDVLDRAPTDLPDMEFTQLPHYSCVPPPGLAGDPDDQGPDLLRRSPPPKRPRPDRPRLPGHPAGEGPGVDDGDQVLDRRSQWLAEFEQFGPLRGRRSDMLRQSGAEDFIFGLEVLDLLGQMSAAGGDQQQEQRIDETRRHGGDFHT